MFLCHPISTKHEDQVTNQKTITFWFTFFTDVLAAKEDNIWKNIRNIQGSTFGDIDFSDFYSFIFEVPVEKIVIDEEELHGIEIDGILNLENLSRTVFFD